MNNAQRVQKLKPILTTQCLISTKSSMTILAIGMLSAGKAAQQKTT